VPNITYKNWQIFLGHPIYLDKYKLNSEGAKRVVRVCIILIVVKREVNVSISAYGGLLRLCSSK